MVTQNELKKLLRRVTLCTEEPDGWTCKRCFFCISEKLSNRDWQTILLTRGSHKRESLDNLPPNIEENLEKIVRIIEENTPYRLREQ